MKDEKEQRTELTVTVQTLGRVPGGRVKAVPQSKIRRTVKYKGRAVIVHGEAQTDKQLADAVGAALSSVGPCDMDFSNPRKCDISITTPSRGAWESSFNADDLNESQFLACCQPGAWMSIDIVDVACVGRCSLCGAKAKMVGDDWLCGEHENIEALDGSVGNFLDTARRQAEMTQDEWNQARRELGYM